MSIYFGRAKKNIGGYRIPDMLSVAWLRFRGWTPAMISKYVGEPDETRRNPHGGAPIRYYDKARIQKIENTPEFAAARAQAERRRKAKNKDTSTPTYPDCVDPGAIVREKF